MADLSGEVQRTKTEGWARGLVKIYGIHVCEMAALVDELKRPGVYEVYFSVSSLESGIYFYGITAGKFSSVRKMIFLK